jgi:acetyltransferase-like isoleucine patch superfamily enzyme
MSRLGRFARLPLYEKLSRLQTAYYRLKTKYFYGPVFKSMGANCIIRRPILLRNCGYTQLGNNVLIRDGVRIEVVLSNPKRTPDLRIGDNVSIEQNVHIVCHSRVIIGSNVSITANCAIVDVTHPFDSMTHIPNIGNRILDEDSYVEIGEGTVLGFGSVVLPNVKIGKMSFVGANSVVTKDIPDYGIAAGVPARLLRICRPED